jgi:hypothetical protein
MSGVKWLCPAALAFIAAPAQAITPEQAQTLPVAELARIVLGEAGVVAVDVDRPKWPSCHICPPLTEEQRKQTPPLQLGLTFYTRMFPERWNNEWRGLCGYHLISVAYDGSGKPSGIGKAFRWGAPHGMKRASTKVSLEDLEAFTKAESQKCAAGTDPRTFFAFDDALGNGPYRIMVAAELFAEAVGRDSPLPFNFKCTSEYGKCEGEGPKEVAERFRSANIASVDQVDCAEPHGKLSSLGPDACYTVQLKDDAESLFLELTGAFFEPRIKRIEYNRVTVVY